MSTKADIVHFFLSKERYIRHTTQETALSTDKYAALHAMAELLAHHLKCRKDLWLIGLNEIALPLVYVALSGLGIKITLAFLHAQWLQWP